MGKHPISRPPHQADARHPAHGHDRLLSLRCSGGGRFARPQDCQDAPDQCKGHEDSHEITTEDRPGDCRYDQKDSGNFPIHADGHRTQDNGQERKEYSSPTKPHKSPGTLGFKCPSDTTDEQGDYSSNYPKDPRDESDNPTSRSHDALLPMTTNTTNTATKPISMQPA